MKNNKLVKLISAFIVGVMFILIVMSVLVVTGVITIGKDELILKTGSQDALYDGSPLTNHEFSMVGELKKGHRIEYEFISSQTAVGETPNELQYKIYDELDADVTADYNIKHEYGTLKVNSRIVLVICEDTNGQIPKSDEYYVDEEAYDGLVYDHKLMFRATTAESSQRDNSAGDDTTVYQSSDKKRWEPVIYDRKNNDVTGNYHIIVNVNVDNNTGNNDESGDETGSGDTNIEMDRQELAEELFGGDTNLVPPVGNENTVLFMVYADNKDKIYLKMESYGEYDGQEWNTARDYYHLLRDTYSASYLTSAALQAGGVKKLNASIISQCGIYVLPYYVSLVSNSQIQSSDVVCSGSTESEYTATYYHYNSAVTLPSVLVGYESAYSEFVYDQYLKIDSASLEYMKNIIASEGFDVNDPNIINKVAQYIQNSADYNLEYDRSLDEEKNVAIAFLDEYKEGVCSHYASAATLLYRALGIPARYTVGAVAYSDGEGYVPVPAKNAHAWVEVYINGLGWIYVEVTGTAPSDDEDEDLPKITITAGDDKVKYQGGKEIMYTNDDSDFCEVKGLPYGYSCTYSVVGYASEIGNHRVLQVHNVCIIDDNGNNVTGNFDIVKENGYLMVYRDVLYFGSDSYVREFDGKTPDDGDVTLWSGTLANGHSYDVIYTGNSSVGTFANSFTVKVWEGETDVTDQYVLKYTFGNVTTTPRAIVFTAASATKAYDKTELICHDLVYDAEDLVDGHRVVLEECVFEGSQTAPGSSSNVIKKVVIVDKDGKDVSNWYQKTYRAGTLTVTVK